MTNDTTNIIPFGLVSENKQAQAPNPDTKNPSDEVIVLVCTRCDCMTHYLHADHTVECANCGVEVDPEGSEWVDATPAVPDAKELRSSDGLVSVAEVGVPELARKSVLKQITEWEKSGELVLMVAYKADGAGRHWTNICDSEGVEQMVSQLEKFIEHLMSMDFGDQEGGEGA